MKPALALHVTVGASLLTFALSCMLVPAVMLAGAPSIVTLGGGGGGWVPPLVPIAWKPTGPWLKVAHEDSAVIVLRPVAMLSRLPLPPEPTATL